MRAPGGSSIIVSVIKSSQAGSGSQVSGDRRGSPPSAGTVRRRPVGGSRQRAGRAAELRALDYLMRQGLRPLASNYRVRMGEIDLILTDGLELVFVEVRQRASPDYGTAAASVTPAKQRRVRRAAQAFLLARVGGDAWPPVRFDVVAIDDDALDWIRAAF